MYPYANRRNHIFVVHRDTPNNIVPRSIDVKICTVLAEHPSQLHGKVRKAFPHFSRETNPCWVSKSSDS